MLAIRLPEKIEKRLARLAKRTGRTKTYYAREAILQHLDDLEDIYYAEKALAEIRSGRSKPIPLEKVMRRYGPEGSNLAPRPETTRRSGCYCLPPNR
jgi:RHH-type transcriptional regulator, rel operon repressor / antitoxin RelB